ncbi:MAG: hypothetical protein AB8G95_01335 [Anaerolineae bacterium]
MEKKFYLNQDHQKVSIVIPIILIVLIIVGYRLFYRTLLPLVFGGQSGDYILIAGVFSLFTSAFLMWLLDPLVKKYLPSGHVLLQNDQNGTLVHTFKGEPQVTLKDRDVWLVTRWQFLMGRFVKSGRERQIPRNWSCMALLIQIEGEELALFSYVRPRVKSKIDQLANWETISMYETLDDDHQSRNMPTLRPPTASDVIPGKLLVGENGKVWLAERKRRDHGIEMSPKDFEELVVFLSSKS